MPRTPQQWADWVLAAPEPASPTMLERRIAEAVAGAVRDEREACAVVAEEVMRLVGSQTAEQIAERIRARNIDD
jgi:hypothetical protein